MFAEAHVVILARNEEKMKAVVKKCEELGAASAGYVKSMQVLYSFGLVLVSMASGYIFVCMESRHGSRRRCFIC